MGRTVIELEGVGKRYRLGEHLGDATDLREAIMARLKRRETTRDRTLTDHWAVRDIDFTVEEGQSLGLVGRNGAGKSTLLKIIAGVTTPTVGVSRTRGRIGSLLEVGTGFHDELTGRENAYLSGAILGMRRDEVTLRLDEIVAFAGLDGFMDTPVKRYSSGMYLRLAFAVAAHLEADILLVDEVLAVGDAEFRRKCLNKMSDVEASGRTVIFASHNLDALTGFCQNAVWIEGGRIVRAGPAAETIREYLRSSAAPGRVVELEAESSAAASVIGVAVLDEDANPQSVIATRDPFFVELEIQVAQAPPDVDVGVIVQRRNTGTVLFDENLTDTYVALNRTGRHRVRLAVPPVLTPAEYDVSVWLGTAYEDIALHEQVVSFTVEGHDGERPDRLFDLKAPWSAVLIDP